MASTIEEYQKLYEAAKAQSNTAAMKSANDAANAIRAASGETAQYAMQDINNTQAQINAVAAKQASTSAMPTAVSGYQSATLPTTNNYSSYIDDLYSAKQEAALAGLESAYKNNVATVDASQAEIAPTYQASRNQTAATSEQQKRNFAEYANANGLNSGTGGQAELARGVTLQNNMNALNTSEAKANADVNLQRTQLANEYTAAIASAKASGNYELASALYQESVRVDDALMSTAQAQAGLDYQAYSTAYNEKQDVLNRSDTQSANDYNKQMAIAEMLAQYGDFSGYAALGIDTTQMKAAYAQQQALSTAKATSSGGGGSTSKPTLTYAQMQSALEQGNLTPNVLSAYQYYMGEPLQTNGGTGSKVSTSGLMSAGIMTQSEWIRHKNAGSPSAATQYDSYADYVAAMKQYIASETGG